MRSVLTALCLFTSTAHAVPGQFTHQGRLLDADGVPLDGEATLTFRIITEDTGGDVVWEEPITVTLTSGFYAAVLGADEADNPLDVEVLSEAPVWLEVQLEGEDPMAPRSPIHAVPYATMATVAEEVSGGPVDASEIAVGGTPVINEAGEWVGPAHTVSWSDIADMPEDFADGTDDDTDTDTDSFTELGTSCLDGDIPVWDSTLMAWACGFDDVLSAEEVDAIVADNGYAMSSEVFSSSFLDLTDVPADLSDGDDDTQLSETEVDAMVADNGYAMTSDVFSGSFSDLSGIPDGLSDGDDNTQLSEVDVDAMVSDNGYAMASDTELLLDRIATLEDQLAAVEDAVADSSGSGVGTVMYGDYNINNSADLAALVGFEEISGNLSISGNIPNIAALDSLTTVGGNLTISNGDALTSMTGLNNVTAVGGNLVITNDILTSLEGLNSLRTAKEVRITSAALTSLTGLDSLESVEKDFKIEGNENLTSLDGVEALTSVGEQIYITSNPALTSVAGLGGLTANDDYININDNNALAAITGLEALTTVGTLNIAHNDALTSLEGLSGLTVAGSSVQINSNDALTSLHGLHNLAVVASGFTVQRNNALTSLEGLSGLTSVYDFTIQINEGLTSLDGLDGLESMTGHLTIFANDNLCRSTALSFRDWMLSLGLESYNINSNKSC